MSRDELVNRLTEMLWDEQQRPSSRIAAAYAELDAALRQLKQIRALVDRTPQGYGVAVPDLLAILGSFGSREDN